MGIVGAKRSGSASGGGETPSQVRAPAMSRIISRAATTPQSSPVAAMASHRLGDGPAIVSSGFIMSRLLPYRAQKSMHVRGAASQRPAEKTERAFTGAFHSAQRAADLSSILSRQRGRALHAKPAVDPIAALDHFSWLVCLHGTALADATAHAVAA